MRKGMFILNKDIYDGPFRDRQAWDSLLNKGVWYANAFVKNIVVEFYREWYYIFNIDWSFRIDHCYRRYELVVTFSYEPEIKPHIAECLEYMIEQL